MLFACELNNKMYHLLVSLNFPYHVMAKPLAGTALRLVPVSETNWMSSASSTDIDPLTPAPLPQGCEGGRVMLVSALAPLGERVARNRRLHQPGRDG